MKIYTWNVNGIRSSWEKGLREFFYKEDPDVLCLQEVKANYNQFPAELTTGDLFTKPTHYLYTNCANKPGYAGVAVLTKEEALSVEDNLGHERFDSEGRMLKVEFKDFVLFNFYFPHGGRMKENLVYKLEVYKKFFEKLEEVKDKSRTTNAQEEKLIEDILKEFFA
jgi:exodeoxyribonuclease-3